MMVFQYFSEVLLRFSHAYTFSDDKNAVLLVWIKKLSSAVKIICLGLIKRVWMIICCWIEYLFYWLLN